MAVDRPVGDCEAGAGEPVDNGVASEDLRRMACEQEQQLELGDRDGDQGIVPARLPALRVEPQPAVADRALRACLLQRAAAPLQYRADPRDHFARTERL